MAVNLGKLVANAAKGATSQTKANQTLRDIVLLAAANRQSPAPRPAPAPAPVRVSAAPVRTQQWGGPSAVLRNVASEVVRSAATAPAPVQIQGPPAPAGWMPPLRQITRKDIIPPEYWNSEAFARDAPPIQGPVVPDTWLPPIPITPGVDTGVSGMPGGDPWQTPTRMPSGPQIVHEDGSVSDAVPYMPTTPFPTSPTPQFPGMRISPLYPPQVPVPFPSATPTWTPAQMAAYPQEFIDYLYSLMFGGRRPRPQSL